MEIRDISTGDIGWVIMRHAELYAASNGFDASFEALVTEILAAFQRDRDAPTERGWIAWEGPTRRGSMFCVRQSAEVAKLRLFFVEPSARAGGLGQLLLHTCLDHARAHGFARLELATHAEHREACALYAKTGFALQSSRPVHAYGVDLTEQVWSIDL